MEQVFINLIANTRDALEGINTPRIGIHTLVKGEHVYVFFIDNGIGIPKKVQAKVFQSLYTTKSRGTGIGLWLFQSVIKQMKGRIQVYSFPNWGGIFTIEIPLY